MCNVGMSFSLSERAFKWWFVVLREGTSAKRQAQKRAVCARQRVNYELHYVSDTQRLKSELGTLISAVVALVQTVVYKPTN